MTEEPQRFSLRPLRYIEPGSDSPWKEVFGTQSDGTHRPQYYSQLELPKVLELLRKHCITWLPPEQAKGQAHEALWTLTSEGSLAQVSDVQTFAVTSMQGAGVQASASEYLVGLYFIFLSSEGKALARATLKLYTTLNASGSVTSAILFRHKKGFSEIGLASSENWLYLRRLLASSSSTLSLLWLAALKNNSGSVKISSAKRLHAFKPQGSGASCRSQISLEYIGYGRGPYGYGLYGV